MGLALFSTKEPPPAAAFQRLGDRGVEVERMADPPGASAAHWTLRLVHPEWGQAVVVRHPALQAPSPLELLVAPALTPAERVRVCEARSALGVTSDDLRGDVFRDRKDLLRWLRVVLGDTGVGALDCGSELVWSPAALDDELALAADLDVSSLYTVHAVHVAEGCALGGQTPDVTCPLCLAEREGGVQAYLKALVESQIRLPGDLLRRPAGDRARRGRREGADSSAHRVAPRIRWIHTHGLAALGAFDFDILRPSPDALAHGALVLRHLALDVVGRRVAHDARRHAVSIRGGDVALVPVEEFMRRGCAEDRGLRDDLASHAVDRSILCVPRDAGADDDGPRISTLLSQTPWRDIVPPRNADVHRRLAARAIATLPALRSLVARRAQSRGTALVQLEIGRSGGPPEANERLWFQFHSIRGDTVEATLVSEPRESGSLQVGRCGLYGIEAVTDWVVKTDWGDVTPTLGAAARMLREGRGSAVRR